MPLTSPAPREPIHTRAVTCRGYRRADGLWDVEGHMTDVKAYGFANEHRGRVEPGEPIHEMWLRLTLDDRFTVVAAEAATDAAPYAVCPAIAPAFQALKGLRVGPGWMREVKARLGGVRGCTHLVELLGPIATTAFQTMYPILSREARDREPPGAERRPVLLDSCHAFRRDGDLARRLWPAWQERDAAGGKDAGS